MAERPAPFRHRPRTRVPMARRSERAPSGWRVVDFSGTDRMGRAMPAPGTRQMELLRLVLDSCSIPYMIVGHGSQCRAFVPALFETLARAELADVASEKAPVPPKPLPLRRNAHWAMLVPLFLIFWHGLRMSWWALPLEHIPNPEQWVQAGKLNVTLVRAGEWWRAATALTLHADSLHLFSNVIFGAPFVMLLAQRWGFGLMLASTVLSGMLGNFANVLYRDPGFASLGFSTAMFSVVGLLCADMVIRSPARGLRRILLPMAAGVGFLALLGAEGENIDYAAHIFGLGAGFLVGLAVSSFVRHDSTLPRPLELALGVITPLFLLLCWGIAL